MTESDDPQEEDDDSNAPLRGPKVSFSDDDDPDAAYTAFINRKSLKRKRAAAQTRKAKTIAKTISSKNTSIVGRRIGTARPILSAGQKTLTSTGKLSHVTNVENEDELLDEVLPDYLKDRQKQFEKNKEKLGNMGLKLPPSYDDISFSDDERMVDLVEKPVLPNVKPSREYQDIKMPLSAGILPAPIARWLRDYQVQGAEFLHEAFVRQRGVILGDDMGLGKTIQVIAFLTAAFGKTGDERDAKRMRKIRRAGDGRFYPRVLIVCPGGLMENWKSELSRWGWWQVYTYHGTPDAKDGALQAATSGRAEIMITTYTTYRMNKSAINTVDWDAVIADECHLIKGRRSEVTQAMNEINALCRIGLTGTAIQNNYEELWTLLNWSNPGRFGSLSTWKSCISEPLRMGQAHDASYQQLAQARKTANSLVKNLLPAFFRRRMKSLIAHQLPKKSDRVVFCPLTDTQTDVYENFINNEIVEYIRTSSEICSCDSGKKRGWCCFTIIPDRGKWQSWVFPCIATLQKVANHVALLIPQSTDSGDKQSKDLDNLQIAFPDEWKELYRQRDSIMNYANAEFCGKWRVLKKLLAFWHGNNDKVLVFSHSVRLLKMLQMLFTSTTSYSVSYLDGSMSYMERAKTVDDFNASASQFVFLISTRAGGVGLNITSANKVVVVDPNWNPSYDLQAQDRAYRIGQERDVEVFRLVSAGTIEEIVYARQIYKQQQANIGYNASSERRYFRGVQDQKEKKGEIFGLVNLFTYQNNSIVLRDIVNKTNIAESRAGVQVADVHLSQEEDSVEIDPLPSDDEDAVMSQLAALITDEKGEGVQKPEKKSDPISAILAGAGVEYTHENSEVIGTSRIESKLSRRAMENPTNPDFINKSVFDNSQGEPKELKEDDITWKYKPPEEVRKRQFCSMAQMFGFEDATEFALVVEGWTQAQRRACLEKFYNARKLALGLSLNEEEENEDDL